MIFLPTTLSAPPQCRHGVSRARLPESQISHILSAMTRNPLLEELIAASVAMTAVIVVLSTIYWLFTGLSPWPWVVVAQVVVFGSGLGVLTLTSPRRRS